MKGVFLAAAVVPLAFLLAGAERVDFWNSPRPEAEAASILLSGLSDEEILGQIFMMTYPGDDPPELLLGWIGKRALGGVKLFGWNAEDTDKVAAAVSKIQAKAGSTRHRIPPFVATDQEGGWIRHVKGATIVTPGNMAIGASGYPSDAYESARYIGLELSALGITMNFAPTVDLATRPRSKIIGPRAFSDDPMATAVLAAAYVRGMAAAGVVCTAKHFPGHGDTEYDSHGVLPVIAADEKTLWDRELVPYRVLAAEGVPAVMSGHLAFPRVTGDRLPASLSRYFLDDILRKKIGFRGIVITDDLFMTGAVIEGGFVETCERAIMAGNDVLMISRTLSPDDPAWIGLLAEYRRVAAFRARVMESAASVIEAKLRYLRPLGRDGVIPASDAARRLSTDESRDFFREQALRSVTSLGGKELPLVPGKAGRVLLAGQFTEFFEEGRRYFPNADKFFFSYQPWDDPVAEELAALEARLGSYDTVIVAVANPAAAAMARAAVASGARTFGVSVLSPASTLDLHGLRGALAVYGYSTECFAAAFAALTGAVPMIGVLPFPADG
ncbi:MAG: glycoside hydrolase family 3 protein [Spirochaetes bacterium]|nr:glycoside hydrolase family 3 protein [Spirochaetota bacterium]